MTYTIIGTMVYGPSKVYDVEFKLSYLADTEHTIYAPEKYITPIVEKMIREDEVFGKIEWESNLGRYGDMYTTPSFKAHVAEADMLVLKLQGIDLLDTTAMTELVDDLNQEIFAELESEDLLTYLDHEEMGLSFVNTIGSAATGNLNYGMVWYTEGTELVLDDDLYNKIENGVYNYFYGHPTLGGMVPNLDVIPGRFYIKIRSTTFVGDEDVVALKLKGYDVQNESWDHFEYKLSNTISGDIQNLIDLMVDNKESIVA